MTALFYYLLKVTICSGVLFFYYHLFLRNKVFHQWNRFYLLAVVLVSLLLPLLQFTVFFAADDANGAAALLRSFQQADNQLEEFVMTSRQASAPQAWMLLLYTSVSVLLLISLLFSLWRLGALIRGHSIRWWQNVRLIDTDVKGTPFSFFGYIFWNPNISLESEAGRQIFRHEVVHVREGHSADKLFLQLVLIACWCNPVFWLIRKELHSIHEFIADQKSLNRHDSEALAALLLQAAYPAHYHSLINPFFKTSLKRRLTMLKKMQNPAVSYASRLLALPLLAVTITAFTVRGGGGHADVPEKSHPAAAVFLTDFTPMADTVPRKKEISAVDVRKSGDKNLKELTITFTDGTSETLSAQEARKRGLINDNGYSKNVPGNEQKPAAGSINLKDGQGTEKKPLFYLDGNEIPEEEMRKIDPQTIEAINVLQGKSATGKYGEKGGNGVIEITLKSGPASTASINVPVVEKTEKPATVDQQAWRAFLQKNLTSVIAGAAAKGAKPGTYKVNVRFLVKKDGSVSDFTALNNPGYELDKEVLAIMPHSPRWNPAEQNGKQVNSYHVQPVTFVITGQ